MGDAQVIMFGAAACGRLASLHDEGVAVEHVVKKDLVKQPVAAS